jgi:hypothetical protein
MQALFVLLGILLLLALIHFKFSAVLALLLSAIVTGLLLGMPVAKLIVSINNGIGSTLGGLVMVLALGASAARGLLGKTVSISKARGAPHRLEDGSELWVTAHPSYLLRLQDEPKIEQERLFQADLMAVAKRLAELTG